MKLEIRGLRAEARIGVTDDERAQPQEISVDAVLEIAEPASDDLSGTLDYRVVIREIRRVASSAPVSLLESLAISIAGSMRSLGASEATVRVAKPRVAETYGASDVAVRVRR